MTDDIAKQPGIDLIPDLLASVRNPGFWAFSSWLDLVTKYRRSALGLLWIFLPAFCYVFGIGYFYSLLFNVPSLPFMVHLGVGYVLWRMITQVITGASTTMATHRAFILDGRVRYTDYVLRVMAKALFYFAVTLVILAPLLAIAGVGFVESLSLFLTLPVFLVNVLWLSVLVAVLGARLPDLHEFSATIFIFGFLLTPIVWRADHMPSDTWRGLIARFNPAFHLIEMVRAPLLGEPLETATLYVLAGMTVTGLLAAYVVYRRYGRFIAVWI
jgi:ABC-2 type transport system permease protein